MHSTHVDKYTKSVDILNGFIRQVKVFEIANLLRIVHFTTIDIDFKFHTIMKMCSNCVITLF